MPSADSADGGVTPPDTCESWMYEVEVYFAIRGDDFDPDEFTRRSGLTPTSVYRRGEPGIYVDRFKFSQWALSSGRIADDNLPICDISDRLVELLESSADFIAKTVAEYDLYAVLQVDWYVCMNETGPLPSLSLSRNTIGFLDRVSAEIEVELLRI